MLSYMSYLAVKMFAGEEDKINKQETNNDFFG